MVQDRKDPLPAFHAHGVRNVLKEYFISVPDLIASKLAAGRPQDLLDAAAVCKAADAQLRGGGW
jgi:hypothetical protein